MNQKQAKKQRKLHKKTYQTKLHKLANDQFQGLILKYCKQRDWWGLIAIIEFIIILGGLLWMIK